MALSLKYVSRDRRADAAAISAMINAGDGGGILRSARRGRSCFGVAMSAASFALRFFAAGLVFLRGITASIQQQTEYRPRPDRLTMARRLSLAYRMMTGARLRACRPAT